jgi:glycosyltransferase involved in cell wall biosynthesis
MRNAVSVQICTLNESRNIRQCLETVLANQPEDILVIDGGSTDETVEIASAMGVRVLSPGKLGLGPSRKLGYMSATTDFVAFVDADDRLPPTWIKDMIAELTAGSYSALQSSLRAANTETWWGRGWDIYFQESVVPTADTIIVGRPALFVTKDLQADESDFESLDEDTHMSLAFEKRGLRQGIGSPVAYRYVEDTWNQNAAKWQSYGRGYREFVNQNPNRGNALIRHMLLTIPFERALPPLFRGQLQQPIFGFLMASQVLRGWFSS